MVNKKKKLGKGRLDTFYHLAKEHGFRSRAAFKLIQLNKKYNFLGQSRTLVDLCAAPGGWLQVAVKHMPVNSVIMGVDLQEIRPIRNVITFTDDITSQSCTKTILNQLKGAKVDVVLHDGAPNMGTNWAQDAYDQADLTLKAAKLATTILRPGGWFITKVFRSGDYNALLWVFNQLFKTVDSTKPMASRNTSAEIFVVCQGYLAPAKIDPRLLDSRHVFKQDVSNEKVTLQTITDTKRTRFRQGYAEEATAKGSLFKKATVSEFLASEDPVRILGENYVLTFDEDSKKYLTHPATDVIVTTALADLKVLAKTDFKNLLRWRIKILDQKKKDHEKKRGPAVPDAAKDGEEGDEDEEGDGLEGAAALLGNKAKRLKRKKLAEKRKTLQKFQLGMVIKGDEGIGAADNGQLFSAEAAAGLSQEQLAALAASTIRLADDERMDHVLDSEEEEVEWETDEEEVDDEDDEAGHLAKLERDLDLHYNKYVKVAKDKETLSGKSKLDRSTITSSFANKTKLKDRVVDEADLQESEPEDDDTGALRASKKNPLLMEEAAPTKQKQTSMWFSQGIFEGIDMDEDDQKVPEDGDDAKEAAPKKKRKITEGDLEIDQGFKQTVKKLKVATGTTAAATAAAKAKLAPKADAEMGDASGEESDEGDYAKKKDKEEKKSRAEIRAERRKKTPKELRDEEKRRNKKDNEFEVVPAEPDIASDDESAYYLSKENLDFRPEDDEEDEFDSLDEEDQVSDDETDIHAKSEVLAIGTQMLRKKRRLDIEDDMFNRHTFNDDDGMPEWFINNERKYTKANMPITKEDVRAIRENYRMINSRPIKKVAEALARKRKRATAKVGKARAKAHTIAKDDTLTPGQKISQVNKIMKRVNQKKGKEKVYVVAKRSTGVGASKPKHVKHARVKIVDSRQKKEVRSAKAAAKNDDRKRKSYKNKGKAVNRRQPNNKNLKSSKPKRGKGRQS